MVVRDARDVERGQWQPAARGWAVSRKASVRAGAGFLDGARVRDVAAMLPRLITGRDEDGMRWHRAGAVALAPSRGRAHGFRVGAPSQSVEQARLPSDRREG